MCHIIMDDSNWLDSFQESVMSAEVKSKDAGLDSAVNNCPPSAIAMQFSSRCLPWESGIPLDMHLNQKNAQQDYHESTVNFTGRGLPRSKSAESLCSTYFRPHTITAPMSVVAQLPAPEFVAGNNSVIASESMRMIAAVSSMHRTGSLGRVHLAAEESRVPFLPPES